MSVPETARSQCALWQNSSTRQMICTCTVLSCHEVIPICMDISAELLSLFHSPTLLQLLPLSPNIAVFSPTSSLFSTSLCISCSISPSTIPYLPPPRFFLCLSFNTSLCLQYDAHLPFNTSLSRLFIISCIF